MGPHRTRLAGSRAGVASNDPTKKRALATLVVSIFALTALLTGATAASAAISHVYESQLTEANGAAFNNPWGLSVDGSDNLWVSDVGPGKIDKFSSAGTLLAQGTGEGHWSGTYTDSIAFSHASSHLYVADSNNDDLFVLNSDATFNSDIKEAPGVEWGSGCCFIFTAADNSGGAANGDVYIDNGTGRAVYRIDGSGNPAPFSASTGYIEGAKLTGTPGGPFASPQSLAVGPNGELLVADGNRVGEFEASGEFVRTITEANGEPLGHVSSVAVNPTSGDLLVGDEGSSLIHEFDSSGAFVGNTNGGGAPSGSLGNVQGLAVDSTGTVYVADGTYRVVDVLGPSVTVPGATTEAATAVTDTEATLHGTVNPAGTATSYQFQYGTTKAYGQVSPASPQGAGSDSADHHEETGLTGLQPSTVYHYRIEGTDSNGTSYGADRTFRTSGPPTIENASVFGITNAGASVHVQINPSGFDTTYEVEYGTSASYGSETTPVDIGASSEKQESDTELVGLQAETTYHYRVVATNSKGSVETIDGTFDTRPAVAIEGQSASAVGKTCATLEAIVNPEGSSTAVIFEYGTSEAYGSETSPSNIGSSTENHPVSAEVCGLSVDTTFHYHAVATNGQGTASGLDKTFKTRPALSIASASVSEVTETSATFRARINPLGDATAYRFEYGTTPSYGTSVPVPDGSAGASEALQQVSQHIQGLLPETTYHYRLVATNSVGTIATNDRAFTTRKTVSASLPDGRGWEMVSPPVNEGEIQPIGEAGVVQASASGNALTYLTTGPSATFRQVFSGRGATAWQALDIQLPRNNVNGGSTGQGQEYRFFSEDLSRGLAQHFGSFVSSISAEASEQTPYVRTNFSGAEAGNPCASSCYRPVVTGAAGAADVPPGTVFGEEPGGQCATLFCGPKFLAATPDLGHLIVSSKASLTATPTEGGLYEWTATAPPSEAIKLISLLPNGQPAPSNSAEIGGERGSISDDGTRVIWRKSSGPGLYLRDIAKGKTVQLDARQGGAGGGSFGSQLQFATPDLSKVFYSTASPLTADAGPGTNLYECKIIESEGELQCDLTDITPSGSGGSGAELQGFVGASPDGSSAYFVANGVLAPGATPGSCGVFSGGNSPTSCDLYQYRNGVTSLVAILSGSDHPDWVHKLSKSTARISPNGRWLTFMSQRELTGYDNHDAASGEPAEEVFLYDSEAEPGSEALVCVSCNPTGGSPIAVEYHHLASGQEGGLAGGDRVWLSEQLIAANVPGWTPYGPSGALHQSRYLSDSGRLFFDSSDALVPQDTNHNEDVYEYEPPGVGDCSTSSSTYALEAQGCVNLISSGVSQGESAFLDAGESGEDVFFLTGAKLTSQDVNTALDVYDAHVCSAGSPCLQPPPPPTPEGCEGNTCQPPAGTPPPTPEGTGNTPKPPHHKRRRRRRRHHKRHRHHHGAKAHR